MNQTRHAQQERTTPRQRDQLRISTDRDSVSRDRADAWDRVDELLDELARLTGSDMSPEAFHEGLLAQAVRSLGAAEGVIWSSKAGELHRVYSHRKDTSMALPVTRQRQQLVGDVIETARSATASVTIDRARTEPTGGEESFTVAIVPLSIEQAGDGALELLYPNGSDHPLTSDHLQVAQALGEMLDDYHRGRQLTECRAREAMWQSLLQLLDRIRRPTLHETSIAIANEGRLFVGCDRVALVGRKGKHWRTFAATGADRIERRSTLVRALHQLAAAVCRTDEPLWAVGETAARPPQIEEALQAYLDVSHSRELVVLLVRGRRIDKEQEGSHGLIARAADGRDSEPMGAIVLEWFTPRSIDWLGRLRIECIERHAAPMLSSAMALEQMPLAKLGRALASVSWFTKARRLSSVAWAAIIALAASLALVFMPADFEITAEGLLRPVQRRGIFAPADGVVEAVLVEHGDDVRTGQVLLRLRSPALELESTRIQGEIQTAEKRLAAAAAARLDTVESKAARERRWQLTAEEEELRESLKNLHEQQAMLTRQRAELEIQSPFDGRILTWDVRQVLAGRPVERGQALLVLGDVRGAWELDLRVPDRQFGYVSDASARARGDGAALPVSFALPSAPGKVYEGELARLALRSQWDDSRDEAYVSATVRLNHAVDGAVPGTTVLAKIDCGRRSLGFVWLHEFWNGMRRWLLF